MGILFQLISTWPRYGSINNEKVEEETRSDRVKEERRKESFCLGGCWVGVLMVVPLKMPFLDIEQNVVFMDCLGSTW